jgi:hypothetical protein
MTKVTTAVHRAAAMLVAGGVATAVGFGSASANAAPLASAKHRHRSPIDDLAPYEPQRSCDPTAKPGVVAFRAMVLRAYPSTFDDGIGRACSSPGRSEHKEGRAWDWGVGDHAVAQRFLSSLLARDQDRHKYALLRRFGIMYIIYDRRIWSSSAAKRGWQPYACSGVTLCHEDHVHFSFSWEGARRQTSGWDGTPAHYRRHR